MRSVDFPICCACKEPLSDDDLSHATARFHAQDIVDVSGSTSEITCTLCGHAQNISPSIEWQTWDL